MKQYTDEFANEWFKNNHYFKGGYIYFLAQDKDGSIYAYINEPRLYKDGWVVGYMTKGSYIGKMLEHPDGWQNSKVTRE